jgi:hypothetical protein
VAVAEVSMELSVDDYLVGGVAMFDAHTGLAPAGEILTSFFVKFTFLTWPWCRGGVRATGCCLGGGVSRRGSRDDRGEGAWGPRRTRGPSSAPTTRFLRPPP